MSSTLSPVFAANFAADVYDVKSSITREDFVADYQQDMELPASSMSTGKTGGYVLNKRHVMAVFSAGKGSYKGAAFVAIKGTASLYDALTDLNAGIKTSHTGCAVHQGFHFAFDSILTELKEFSAGTS